MSLKLQRCDRFGHLRFAVFAALASVLMLCAAQSVAAPRELVQSGSPSWLAAIGKLQVPGAKYVDGHSQQHRENCSATLITPASAGRVSAAPANTIITAWHCLEYYTDLSKTITFTLLYGTQESFSSEAVRLSDGGGMDADWAVLRLRTAVSADRVAALAVHPGKADPKLPITMAGYSKNSPGERLSFDPSCAITSQPKKTESASNCKALKGASGGAVIQLSATGQPLLAGVISQGDSENISIFVPVASFRSAIQAGLSF